MQLLGSSFPQPGGDIELVTTLEPSAQWSLLDHVQAEDELGEILGQKVDILGRHTIDAMQNALNRSAYLSRIGVTVYG